MIVQNTNPWKLRKSLVKLIRVGYLQVLNALVYLWQYPSVV